jgi:hypothetical protein
MPTLTYNNSTSVHGGILNSRVLIGRRLSHGVVLEDAGVSRLHAWIDPIADEHAEWVITDAGSKTGTYVNDEPVTRHPLHDGDQIRVGSVVLTYHDADTLPPDIAVVELSSPSGVVRTSGILFECACGAPLWVGSDLAGKRGMCRHCRQPVTVPAVVTEPAVAPQPSITPPPSPSTAKKSAKCAVCHSAIVEGEEQTQCPDCAMVFHTECWQENFGCSSYGCPQVNVLQPPTEETAQIPVESTDPEAIEPPHTTHWEQILVAASIVGLLGGALSFGSVAALVAIFAIVILIKGKARRPVWVVIAIAISLIGVVAGLAVSDFYYFDAHHVPPALLRLLTKYGA